jgi:hypothetical protein
MEVESNREDTCNCYTCEKNTPNFLLLKTKITKILQKVLKFIILKTSLNLSCLFFPYSQILFLYYSVHTHPHIRLNWMA